MIVTSTLHRSYSPFQSPVTAESTGHKWSSLFPTVSVSHNCSPLFPTVSISLSGRHWSLLFLVVSTGPYSLYQSQWSPLVLTSLSMLKASTGPCSLYLVSTGPYRSQVVSIGPYSLYQSQVVSTGLYCL